MAGPAILRGTRWSLRAGLPDVEACFETAPRHATDEDQLSPGLFAQAFPQTWAGLLPERMSHRRPVACRPWRTPGRWNPAAVAAGDGRELV